MMKFSIALLVVLFVCTYLPSAHVYSCVSFSASPDGEWQAMTNRKVNIGLPKILSIGVIHIQYLAEDSLYCRTMLVWYPIREAFKNVLAEFVR